MTAVFQNAVTQIKRGSVLAVLSPAVFNPFKLNFGLFVQIGTE